MRTNVNIDIWLSRIGLGLIFSYTLLASIFFAPFAQIHVTIECLPFPIFLGEILLFICLVLFLNISKGNDLFSPSSILLLGLYFGWLIIKASINFHFDGPLTARNAALFYYPVFAVFAYVFYRKAMIPSYVFMSLAVLAAGILFFKVMFLYYWWTYITLFTIVVWNIKSVKWRSLGWAFLAVILLLGKEYLYKGSRSNFVSVFASVVFLTSYFGMLLARRRNYVVLGSLLIGFFVFILGFFIFSNRNDISSVTSLKGMIDSYYEFDENYQAAQGNFVPQQLPIHLYNYKKFSDLFPSSGPNTGSNPASNSVSNPTLAVSPEWVKKIATNHVLRCPARDERSYGLDEDNIVFRLFVWRDMIHELIEQRAWWGFSFGHPQRSKSLEVLHWAEAEWSRDGWITPHNSFLHIIYRAGILGVLFISVFFFMIGRLVKDFYRAGSIEGGLLVGALIYWLVLSNFLIILEFPYNAILFWSLFGIACAYRDGLKEKVIK